MSQNSASDCVVQQHDTIFSSTSCYLVLEYVGKGSFGQVVKTVNIATAKDVALKIVTSEDSRASKRELKMLRAISALEPVKANVVHFLETFEHEGLTCLAFKNLDRNLFQLLMDRQGQPLSLNEIRPIANQLLTAFDALKGIGVIHADLKPDNIMLVNHQNQPFRVKLIDFGLSLHTSEVRPGLMAQATGYRAPEVILGLPFTEAIDMWGLGCVLSVLYLSCHLLGVRCEYQQTPMEYKLTTGIEPKECQRALNNLDELVTLYPALEEDIQLEDRRAFLSLLKCLLHTDHEQRISPDKALIHPFISMVHLQEELDTSMYVEDSFNKMIIQTNDSDEELTIQSEVEEEMKAGETSSLFHPDPEESAPANIYVNINILNTSDGTKDASAEDISAVSHCAAQEDSEENEEELRLATDGPSVIEAPAKVKRSSLRRIRKFFSRAIRTVFRIKKKS